MNDELPCNIVAYYTTRPLMRFLHLPLYWRGIYLPHLPLMPLFIAWGLLGVAVIMIFGGLFLIIGKEHELIKVWLK
jgi:hypothetical protein